MGYPSWDKEKISQFVDIVALELAAGKTSKEILEVVTSAGIKRSTGREYVISDFYSLRARYRKLIQKRMKTLGAEEIPKIDAHRPRKKRFRRRSPSLLVNADPTPRRDSMDLLTAVAISNMDSVSKRAMIKVLVAADA